MRRTATTNSPRISRSGSCSTGRTDDRRQQRRRTKNVLHYRTFSVPLCFLAIHFCNISVANRVATRNVGGFVGSVPAFFGYQDVGSNWLTVLRDEPRAPAQNVTFLSSAARLRIRLCRRC